MKVIQGPEEKGSETILWQRQTKPWGRFQSDTKLDLTVHTENIQAGK